MTARVEQVEAQWTRLGAFFSGEPATRSPDLERLLLVTAPALGGNARLFPLVATWLVEYGNFVAPHRLKRLALAELNPRGRAALGLLLETAIDHGARRDLRVASLAFGPNQPPSPLFGTYQGIEWIAEETASALSRKWGLWAPEVELKRDAIRPVEWLLKLNPEYRDRAVRKGDLRTSILETLRRDRPGVLPSAAEVARLTGATRAAVRKALDALVQEGAVTVGNEPGDERSKVVRLKEVA